MALKTDALTVLIIGMLQVTWAQQVITPDTFYKIFANIVSQQADAFSNSGQHNFNLDSSYPSSNNYNNFGYPQLDYENAAAALQSAHNDFYNNAFRGFPFGPFVPMNTAHLEPDLALFLAFCNLQPVHVCSVQCDGAPAPTEAPSTSNPNTTSTSPASDPASSFVSDSVTSNSPSQTPPSKSTVPNPPSSTEAPTTQSTTTRQPEPSQPPPATSQQPSSVSNSTTEDPSIITIRLDDPDEDALETTTEEQYLPLDFDIVKPDRELNITIPPILHAPTN